MEFFNTFKTFWKSKRIPESYDTYSTLELVWIWRVCGNIIVVLKGPIGHRKYFTSKFCILYNFSMLCLFTGMLVGRLWNKYIQEYIQALTLEGILCMYVRLCINSTTMFELFFWKVATSNRFIEMCDSLNTQDKLFKEKLKHEFNYKLYTKKNGICVGFYILTHILMTCQQISYGFSFGLLIDYFSWWFPIIIHKSNLCLFMSLVWMLGMRFKALNKKLVLIIQSSGSRDTQATLVCESYIEMFRTIAIIHRELCKIGESINHIFMITLVISVIEAFVSVTLILFCFIIAVQKSHYDVPALLTYSLILISCSTAIIIIVIICNWTRKKASAAEKLIHKIKVQNTNNSLSQLIQALSMQMFHQKLSFSVGGLFTLEPALLQAVAGVITTYLVILIQFGQMEVILLKKNE